MTMNPDSLARRASTKVHQLFGLLVIRNDQKPNDAGETPRLEGEQRQREPVQHNCGPEN